MQIAILGGGLAGLELGRRLGELGKNFVILEKESRPGGLCRTNRTGAYTWDYGVHAMYSRSDEVMRHFRSLPLDYQEYRRSVRIFHSGSDGKYHLLDYPFEVGIKDLPLRDRLECVRGYMGARLKGKKNSANLEDWIGDRLGSGIARHFMIPYNRKIWDCDLSRISCSLVTSKIDPSPVTEFVSAALGRRVVGRAYQAGFLYPSQGIQQLTDLLAEGVKESLRLNSAVRRLIRSDRGWKIVMENGGIERADTVVSTMPLVELLKLVDVPGLEKGYEVFEWNNTFFVMVGLKEGHGFKLIDDCHWAFFKEEEVFYRLTLMHNFSSEFQPALVAEITMKDDAAGRSKGELAELVVTDLVRRGIIAAAGHVAETDVHLVRYTYPIPTVGLEKVKGEVSALLRKHDLYLLGRSGNWDYINMDEVIRKVQRFAVDFAAGG